MDQAELQDHLNALAGEALRLEATGNLAGAVGVWRQVLALLPVGSVPYRQIEQRVGELAGGFLRGGEIGGTGGGEKNAGVLDYQPRTPKDDPFPLAVAKTAGSMLISAIVYYFFLFHNV